MLEKDPEKRISSKEILAHPYLNHSCNSSFTDFEECSKVSLSQNILKYNEELEKYIYSQILHKICEKTQIFFWHQEFLHKISSRESFFPNKNEEFRAWTPAKNQRNNTNSREFP